MAIKNAAGSRFKANTRNNGSKKKLSPKAKSSHFTVSATSQPYLTSNRDLLCFQMLNHVPYPCIALQQHLVEGELVDLVLIHANNAAYGLLDGNEEMLGYYASALPHGLFSPILAAARKLGQRSVAHSINLQYNSNFYQITLSAINDETLFAIIEPALKTRASDRHKHKLARFMEAAPDAIFIADLEGRYVHVNAAACQLLGYSRDEILHKPFSEIIPDAELNRLLAEKSMLNDGGQLTAEWSLTRSDGSLLPVEVSGKLLNDGHWLAFVRDISHRKSAEKDVHLAAAVFNNTREAIVIADTEQRIVAVNAAFTDLTGYSEAESTHQLLHDYLYRSGKHEDEFYQTLWQRVDSDGLWRGEVWSRRKDGEIFPSWQNISVVSDDDGEIRYYVLILSDISEKKAAEMKLSYLAHHDALTGLANRIAFNGNLERALQHATRNNSKVALLYIDLDNFKTVNDTYGHLAGDQLLQITADRLRRCVRGEDAVARMGGDEFTIVLENISCTEDAVGVAKKVLHSMELPVRLANGAVEVGMSIGISIFPDHANSLNDITRTADAAMYSAKKQRINSYQVFLD